LSIWKESATRASEPTAYPPISSCRISHHSTLASDDKDKHTTKKKTVSITSKVMILACLEMAIVVYAPR
jgi:hypothetical protein